MPKAATVTREERLLSEEAAAWSAYLDDTRNVAGVAYEEVESWAWDRLARKLRSVAEQREQLRT